MDLSDGELERRGRGGDVEALLALGTRYAGRSDVGRARACFAQAAKRNSVVGLRELAKSLLVDAPVRGDEGVAMMRGAAEKSDGEAIYLCAVLAAQDVNLPDRWTVAADTGARAARENHVLAREEQALLQRSGLTLDALAKPVPPKTVFEAPFVAVIEKFIPPEVCDWLITRAKPELSRAHVYDTLTQEGLSSDARTNSEALFGILELDLVMMAVRERVRTSAMVQKANLERLSILHYAPGERFEPHFDFLDSAVPAQARDLASGGQRAATLLVYLNEDFEGGETEFLELGYRYKGGKGDAILFRNVTPDGAADPRTFHAGLPPTRGEKWLLSQWIRATAA